MLVLQAYLDGFSSRKDKSAGIRFSTQELSPQQFATLQEKNGDFGWLVFSPNEITMKDIPTEHAEDNTKTPSKRLRATLFVLWEQKGRPTGNFETFYTEQMEKFINRVKSELD
jgi:hypothetical protein